MQQNYSTYFSLDILCGKSKMKQSLKTKLSPQLFVFSTAKMSAQDLQSTEVHSPCNNFSLSHFTCSKCHKCTLLHQVRACNHFVWPAMF